MPGIGGLAMHYCQPVLLRLCKLLLTAIVKVCARAGYLGLWDTGPAFGPNFPGRSLGWARAMQVAIFDQFIVQSANLISLKYVGFEGSWKWF